MVVILELVSSTLRVTYVRSETASERACERGRKKMSVCVREERARRESDERECDERARETMIEGRE